MTMGTAFTPSGSGDSVKFSLTNQGADWDVECSETGGGGTASGNFPLGKCFRTLRMPIERIFDLSKQVI